jgi:hypothetical protein
MTNCHARRGRVAGLVWSKDCVNRTLILGRILTTITCKIKGRVVCSQNKRYWIPQSETDMRVHKLLHGAMWVQKE